MTDTVTSVKKRTYLVLMPMRNEIAAIETTLQGLIRQNEKPTRLLVLADGSTDGSNEVVARYAAKHPWIHLEQLPDRGFDLVGQGVAQVLNYGLKLIRDLPSDFVAKVDADLDLPPEYFERLMDAMEAKPSIGIASGRPFTYENGRKLMERCGDHFPTGTARIYRREALDQIGEYVNSVGWDTVDILRLRMRGYTTRVLEDLELHHMRRRGTRNGYIDGMVRDGRNAYVTGYDPLFFFLRSTFNGLYRPYLLRTACMLWGYSSAWRRKLKRAVNDEELAFHRRLLRRRLLRQPINT